MTKLLFTTASAAALALSTAAAAHLQDETDPPIQENKPVAETTDNMNTEAVAEDLNEGELEATAEATAAVDGQDKKAKSDLASTRMDKADDMPAADPAELAQAREETAEALSVLSNLTTGHMSAREVLGAPVTGANGERIARIDDLIVGSDNQIDQAILLSGGFFGLGGQKAVVDFDDLNITYDTDREPQVSIAMTEESIDQVAEYEQTEMNDWSLASELIGASGSLGNSDRDVTITDIIVSQDGEAEYLIAADGLFAAIGGDRRAIDFDRLNIAQGDGGVMIDVDPETYDSMTLFTYSPGAEAKVKVDKERTEHKAKKSEKRTKPDNDEDM